jgi:UDP-N-acetylglucosamine--N-acetylmuramyl-(pentapeptide) pyrophosphoryl-undecaprenol N-acetylglucosamine transferase
VPVGLEPSLILLSLGTHQQPFPRALDLVEPLARSGEDLLIQHGSTAPRLEMLNAVWVEFMPYDEVVHVMAKADSVICHAGVGTIMTALQAGHLPVVIPRLARHGEHVDDHQLDIASRFADRGLVRCVTTETDLAPLLTPRHEDSEPPIGKGSTELRAAVSGAVAAKPRRRLAFPFRGSISA